MENENKEDIVFLNAEYKHKLLDEVKQARRQNWWFVLLFLVISLAAVYIFYIFIRKAQVQAEFLSRDPEFIKSYLNKNHE